MTYSWQDVWKLRTELYSFLGNYLLDSTEKINVLTLDPKTWADFPLDPANEQMKSGLEQLIKCTSSLQSLSLEEAIQKVKIEYTELFIGPGKPIASPWESVYRTDEKVLFGWPTFQVRKVMSRNGFEVISKNKTPEDHIGLELVFLSALSEKLGQSAEANNASILKEQLKEQINFITEHPLAWIPELSKDASQYGSLGYYGGLIELIWGFLLWDKDILEEAIENLSSKV